MACDLLGKQLRQTTRHYPSPAGTEQKRSRTCAVLEVLGAESQAIPAAMASDPFALTEAGTAVDWKAFQAAIRADPVKLRAVQEEDATTRDVLLGDNEAAFQDTVSTAVKVRQRHLSVAALAGLGLQ